MKKWISMLLALAMCVGLAAPAYAEELETPYTEPGQEETGATVYWWGTSDPIWEEVETEGGVVRTLQFVGPDLMSADTFSTFSAQRALLENCPICGKNNWRGEPQDGPYACEDDGDSSTHIAHYLVPLTCQTPGCMSVKWDEFSQREAHSMDFDGYQGSNYHRGSLHYVGYQYHCTVCGYVETRYESTPCPGNAKGEGCIFAIHDRVEPPVEVESVAPGEDMTTPEESDVPEEVIPPEEEPTPEEVTAPEETVIPEETDMPEEVVVPEETENPEGVTPEEADVPEETEPAEEVPEPGETLPPEDPPIPEETSKAE